MNLMKRAVVFSILLLISLPGFSGGSDNSSLSLAMTPVNSLKGQFLQKQFDESGVLISQSSGDFWVKAPNKIYWQTIEPFVQSLISDGITLWIYDPDLEQVTVSKFDSKMAYAPSMILSGDSEAVAENYVIETVDKDTFRLTPIAKGLFSNALVTFEQGLPQKMEITDELGQLTVIALSSLIPDMEIDDKRFSFTPSPEIDVLGTGL